MNNFNKKDSVAEEVEKILAQEAELSHKQKKIAALAGDKKVIDALDLAALRAGKKPVDVEEGFGDMDKYLKDKEKEKGTGKYDKKKISTGTVYQKKHNAPKEDEKDDMKEDVEQIDELKKSTVASYIQKKFGKMSDEPVSKNQYGYAKKDAKGIQRAGLRMSGIKATQKEEVELDEAVSRKHFQQVADLIKTHDSQEKRKELAQHHASIFKTQNPRFDHAKFMKAAGVNEGTWAEEADCVTPPQAKKIAKKEVKGHEKSMHHQEEIDTDVRTKDMLKGRKPTKQTDDVGPGSDGKSTKVRYHGGPHPSNEEVEQMDDFQAEELIENFEMINEVSLGAKIKAYAHHSASSWEAGDYGHDEDMEKHQKRADKIHAHILKHHGTDAAHHAEKAADSAIFGTERSQSRGKDTLSGGLRNILSKNVTKAGKIPKTTQGGMKNVAKGSYGNRVSGPKGNLPEEVELDERSLTPTEKKEKEHMVMSMKPKLKDFKKRYGERAKEVMYATATKRAKGE